MRIERIGDCELYLGDCRDIDVTDIDVTITDPPYSANTHGKHLSTIVDRDDINFESISGGDFAAMCEGLVNLTKRWVVMTCDWRHIPYIRDNLVRHGIWVKPNGSPQYTGDRPGSGWEAVAILHRDGKKRWNGGGHHAVWIHNIEQGDHPTQKPLPLITKFVKLFSDEGEKVFDPFMGSGTTGVACVNMGRRFIGVEIDEKYFALACRRIEEAYRQPRLEFSKPMTQGELLDGTHS